MLRPAPLRRAAHLVAALIAGLVIAVYVAAAAGLGRRPAWTPRIVRWWHGRICRSLDLQVRVQGAPAPAALLIANHVSWLDVPVLGALGEIGFLSKAEVRQWPAIGWLAAVAGTLFIARGANQTAELTAAIATRIRAGQRVAIFPEGTTTDGSRLLRFHPRLFAVGQGPGIRIQPVALRYGSGPQPDPIAPFVGDDNLIAHLLRLLRHPGLEIRVDFLAPIEPSELDRRTLAEQAQAAIAGALGVAAPSVPIRSAADNPGRRTRGQRPAALTASAEAVD